MAFVVEIKEKLGVLGDSKNNRMELRLISWNNGPVKYDIRGWYNYNGEERCNKGITLTENELRGVSDILNKTDFSDETEREFGAISQSGGYEIVINLSKYGYGIRSCKGSYSPKGVTLTVKEIETLRDILNARFGGKVEVVEVVEVDEPKHAPEPPKEKPSVIKRDENDKIIHALTHIPVNDSNYPLKEATAEQLREAIKWMEANPNGQKTRLDRCKAKLKSLEKGRAKTAEPPKTEEVVEETTEVVKETPKDVSKKLANDFKESKKVIEFPKVDTTKIVKLAPTGEGHSYEEAVEKLSKERKQFEEIGDSDSLYVIDGILEACVSDQELLDNVMRPEKNYLGALQYVASKAKAGYGVKVNMNGGYGVMITANNALKYAIDYFNSEEPKKEEQKVPKTTATKKEASTKKATAKKAPRKTTRKTWRRR